MKRKPHVAVTQAAPDSLDMLEVVAFESLGDKVVVGSCATSRHA